MPLDKTYLQKGGVVHGGIISTLADTAAVYTVHPYLTENQSMTSIEFKMNFLSPALFENGDLLAQAILVKRGRKVAHCDFEVYQKEKACCEGTFFLFIVLNLDDILPKPCRFLKPARFRKSRNLTRRHFLDISNCLRARVA